MSWGRGRRVVAVTAAVAAVGSLLGVVPDVVLPGRAVASAVSFSQSVEWVPTQGWGVSSGSSPAGTMTTQTA